MEKLQEDTQKYILEIDTQMEAWDVVHSHSVHYFNAIITCVQRLNYFEKVNENPNTIELLSTQNSMNLLLSSKQTTNLRNFFQTIYRNHVRYSKIIQKMESISKENYSLIENYFNSIIIQPISISSPKNKINPNGNRNNSPSKLNNRTPNKNNNSPNKSNNINNVNKSSNKLNAQNNIANKNSKENILEEKVETLIKLKKTSIFHTDENGEQMNQFSYSTDNNYPDVLFTLSIYQQILHAYNLQFVLIIRSHLLENN